ncbi:TIR domain-containing protein [Arthrobacter sp. SAFR-179]|uniref:TIR domain-containing protein n=1 Tax=Arthrobacter sp. SAFR-179 TaxID=3387279 RepID=UPI003F7BE59C
MAALANLFIGSSSEGKDVAERLHAGLDRHGLTESTVWTHGVFRPSQHPLTALVGRAQASDFAVMVLSPDDDVESRESRTQAPRDNVIFELGLFMGALGPERTYMVLPKGVDLKLPTDLAGITYLPYPIRQDGNTAAALNGVVLDIIDEVKRLGPRMARKGPTSETDSETVRDVDSLAKSALSEVPGEMQTQRETAQNAAPGLLAARHAEQALKALEEEINWLCSNATSQGWSVVKNNPTTLRLRSPKGKEFTLPRRRPAGTRAELRKFVAELRANGLRVNRALQDAVEHSPFG